MGSNNRIDTHKNILTISNMPRQAFSKPREGVQETILDHGGTTDREIFVSEPRHYRFILNVLVGHNLVPKTVSMKNHPEVF